jgi:hypothetical protein
LGRKCEILSEKYLKAKRAEVVEWVQGLEFKLQYFKNKSQTQTKPNQH